MCGITGFVDFSGGSTREHLSAMTGSLIHRGPDDEGCEYFQTTAATIGLGFRRLAILDLSPAGHQPMYFENNRCWIVFNGEIYNFRELRDELEGLGHKFISNSDTEVILHAYQQWGAACVNRFLGMFAFCIFDTVRNCFFMARDRAGVKPLFYYWNDGLLLFASELKAFHHHPAFKKVMDVDALSLYFQFGYIPAPYSVFENGFKLLPGHTLEFSLDDCSLRVSSYWDAVSAYNAEKLNIGFEDAIEQTERLFTDAFNYRMISDVPVGVFLSGGYDSSCVAALLQRSSTNKIKTFTIGFEEEAFNEAAHAAKVAEHLGTDHHEYTCTYREAMDIVPDLATIYDEPFGDSSAIPTTLVSRFARKHVTVALSADAGDELFAGYPRHRKNIGYLRKLHYLPDFISRIASAVVPAGAGPLVKADRMDKLREVLRSNDPVSRFKIVNQVYTAKESRKLLRGIRRSLPTVFDEGSKLNMSNDNLSRLLLTEYKSYLVDDILQKVDRATMSASLEGREPFLDHRILEWVARLPSGFKMNERDQKVLLKAIVHRHIPEAIMKRPKMGFGIPLVEWMRNDLRHVLEDVMSDQSIRSIDVLDAHEVMAMRDAYLEGRLENFERLWLVFSFILWHRRWMTANG